MSKVAKSIHLHVVYAVKPVETVRLIPELRSLIG